MRQLVLTVLAVASVSACSGTASSTVSPTGVSPTLQPAPSQATATPAPTPTPLPTVNATPEPSADVHITREAAHYVNDNGSLYLNYVVEVENTGIGYADLNTHNNSYTVYDKGGGVLATGDFLYMFPSILGPGEKAYYIESVDLPDGTKSSGVGKTEAQLSFDQAPAPDTKFDFSHLTFKKSEFNDRQLEVSGVVKNVGTGDAPDVVVGVVVFDGGGAILGGLLDNDSHPVATGSQRGFKAWYPSLAGKLSAVKKYFASAMPEQ